MMGTIFSLAIFAQQQGTTPAKEQDSIFSNPMFIIMLCVVILLLFVIIGMSEVVKAGAMKQLLKSRAEKEKSGNTGKIVSAVIFLLAATSLFAQDPAAPAKPAEPPFTYWDMGAGVFYVMMSVIVLEVIFIYMLYRMGMALLDRDEMRVKLYGAKKAEGLLESKLMKSLTDAVPVEEEAAVMMDHDYDGIRELDNNLPPWWKYGFYLTIAVAIIYLFNFHVLHTGKLSIEEYNQEMKDGDAAVAEYQKTAVNLVDEKTVKLLTDPASLAGGKAIFKQNCVACHGEFGEGKEGLGPNFTDDYWLHGGSVNDVFRSVKYGWTDKGMKSWQQDLKPSEIQLVVSYVKSLRGTNPPNPKEKQGELYIEDGAKPLVDSAASGNDSLPKPANDSVKK